MIRSMSNLGHTVEVGALPSAPRGISAHPAVRVACVLLLTFLIEVVRATPAAATDVRLTYIDGTSSKGQWVGSADGRSIEIREGDAARTVPLALLARVGFGESEAGPAAAIGVPRASAAEAGEAKAAGWPPGSKLTLFHLADGGRLPGVLLDPPEEGDVVYGTTALARETRFPFDRLAGIQLADADDFPSAHAAFLAALADPLPGHDMLITRGADEGQKLRGRLVSLGSSEGSFDYDGQVRSFQVEKIYAVVMARGIGSPRPGNDAVTLTLVDGARFTGVLEHGDANALQMATSLGFVADVSIDRIVEMRVSSDLVVYLSDLTPKVQQVEGLLHRPWPIRLDRNVAGGLIVMGSKRFERGLGVHSRAALTYELDGGFEKFAATIGLDDSVRPRGSVQFRILAGANVLFESGEVTGADPPREVLVDVSGVELLTLFVDFGQGLDVADHANWGDARLLKPLPRSEPAKRQ